MTLDGEVKAIRAVTRRMRGATRADARQLAAWAKSLDDAARALERGHRFLRQASGNGTSAPQAASEPSPGRATPGQRRRDARRTSAASSAAVEPRTGTQRWRVLHAVGAVATDPRAVGLTDVEIQDATGLPANSLRPRRGELVDGGWLEDSGRTRTHHGNEHVVWVLSSKAVQLLAADREGWGA